MPTLPVTESLTYASRGGRADGLLVAVTPELTDLAGATALDLREAPGSKRAVLWFRRGAKRIFYLKAVRRAGRLVIEIGGLDRRRVLQAVAVCRAHFDRLFGITAEDVKAAIRGRNERSGRRETRAS